MLEEYVKMLLIVPDVLCVSAIMHVPYKLWVLQMVTCWAVD